MGPFEFPIAGDYVTEREGGATVFIAADESHRLTVGLLRKSASAAAPSMSEQTALVESLVRNSWDRFVKSERGQVVRAFLRTETPAGLTLFSMATEFTTHSGRQYYVQFAVTDGVRLATVFAEGSGSALEALAHFEPSVLRVRLVE